MSAAPRSAWDLGTEAGFGAFYDAAIHPVYAATIRLTGGDRSATEDVVQDAFREVVAMIRRGRRDIDVGLVVTIARRRYIDRIRRTSLEERKLRLVVDRGDALWPAVAGERVAAALSRLPAEQRVALVLRHVEEMSVPEVASELGKSTRATEQVLSRARRAMRVILQEEAE